MSQPTHAIVSLGDEQVGILERRKESSRFVPTEAWAEQPAGSRLVLGQQFEDDPFSAHGSRYGAPIWFEHLLPEAGGPLRNAVARAVGVASPRSFPLLLALGDDLPGAVRVQAATELDASGTVARREQEVATAADRRPELPLRVSLAGLQFKLSARMGDRGIALPAFGEEADWILKFADQRFPTLAENEFTTMTWARAAGITAPEVRLVPTEAVDGLRSISEATGNLAFAIRRYDRENGTRIHQEDFAQILGLSPGDAKYTDTNLDTIVRLTAQLCPDDVGELIARIVFCVICGNDDAHAKNWSLWYPDGRRPRLSPAYDLVTTTEYFPDNDMSLKLAKARRFDEVNRARFARLADRTSVSRSLVDDVVVESARRQMRAWDEIREQPTTRSVHRRLIDERMQRLPLARELA